VIKSKKFKRNILFCACFAMIAFVCALGCITPDEERVYPETSFDIQHGWNIFQTTNSYIISEDADNPSFEYVQKTRSVKRVGAFHSFSYYSDYAIEHSGQKTTHVSRMIIMDDGENTVVWLDVDGAVYINAMWYMYNYRDWVDGKRQDKPNIDDDFGFVTDGDNSYEDERLKEFF
jgi:hypothetical protein